MRDLVCAFAKTAGGSAAALLMGMAAVKILAVLVGPAGMGVFSLLRQTQQTAVLLALFNGQNALVQGIASRAGEEERRRYVSVVFWIVATTTLLVALIFVAAPGAVAQALAGRGHYGPGSVEMVRFLALSIVFSSAYLFVMSVLNGYRFVGRGALVQWMSYFALAALAYPFGLLARDGNQAAFAWLLSAGAAAAALLGMVMLWRAGVARVSWPRWTAEEGADARHFLKISVSMLISGAIAYGEPLIVRSMIVRGFDFAGAGIFDVAWTLSMAYVMILLTAFSAYYLPTLSGIQDPQERTELVRRVLHLSVLVMLPLVTAVVVFKPLVISILYTGQFTPALRIMRWMLIGDFFKVLSWVFSFTMLAYADMKMFLSTEIIWAVLGLAGSYAAINWTHSLEHLGFVFMLLYVLYLIVMAWYVRRRHALTWGKREVWGSLAALCVIVTASALTWNDDAVRWPIAIACSGTALAGSWLLMTAANGDTSGRAWRGDARRRDR
jgi:O-antigen/teichoic acid export membrane protein